MRKSNKELWRGTEYPFNVDTPMSTLLGAFADAVRADEAEHAKAEQRQACLDATEKMRCTSMGSGLANALYDAIENAGVAPVLKPCPFCGGEPQTDFAEPDHYMIECREKSCRVRPWSLEKTEVAAIAAWNKRP